MKGPTTKGRTFKFIQIRQDGDENFDGQPVYRIYNNRSGEQIGIISFYKPWKQYVFSSQPECVFNDACLRDVLSFIGEVNPRVIF